ncbi:hypothetical protein H8B06_07780 [Sphingobacterium sp. DN00404]|uniref:Uncharacterized protein n=1 Tax=Sphingobacterium micropteri TaxID=2763501 RepID=A0ABR7YNG9_9SPHI|nr:hypothetical protein [Sphingobacterium micropteri]MBD1432718.1 hypothetical protein [Sphingobacterium micropteri]
MAKENQKPKLRLKKKYREEMESKNLTVMEYLEKRRQEKKESERRAVEEFLKNNPKPPRVTEFIALNNNAKNLGFKRRFFTAEDAEFLTLKLDRLCEEDIWEFEPLSQDRREELLQALIQTGVCYDFKNLGVTIYATWGFEQTNCDNDTSYIDYGYCSYYYNHFTKEFREVNEEESFEIEF